jgi:SAM-dependent methyltransferase
LFEVAQAPAYVPFMTKKMTDTAALAAHRARATRDGLFLHSAAADELQDRLDMVNKSFTSQAIVTGFPNFWTPLYPSAKIVSDAETLDLEVQSFDMVAHVMGLHWANDPVGQLIQCRRALKPDGLFIAISFGSDTLHELRRALGEAEIAVTGGLSPRIVPLPELRDLGGLLQRAGFALPVADTATLAVEYRDIWHLMHDLRAMGETNALVARLRRPTRRAVFEQAQNLYAEHFAAPSGRLNASFELQVLTGWAPDASQPQPLRPGSAQRRLADALGSAEKPLHD